MIKYRQIKRRIDCANFRRIIKKQREMLGISQRELSRQTGVDNNTIAKLEKGTKKNTLALKN